MFGVAISMDSCMVLGFGFCVEAKGLPLLDWQEVLTRQSQYPTTLTQVSPSIKEIISVSVCVQVFCQIILF